MKLKAEIIAIGTEILLGDIVNTNASYIARGLALLGIDTFHQQVVGDNPARVKQAFEEAYRHANLIITSGGLGPTEDDLSKEMGAEYFGVPLRMDEIAKNHIAGYMLRRGRAITDNNWKQAMLPEGCIPLYNDNGTAPGFILSKDEKILIMLPGPPSEIVPMFDGQVIPYLRSLSEDIMISRTLHICGMGESAVEDKLHDEMISMSNPTLAPYAKEGIVDLRITAKGKSEAQCLEMIRPVEDHIRELFGDLIFGADEETLTDAVLKLLRQMDLTVSAAESSCGGLIADRFVRQSGTSDRFMGSVTAYSNRSKVRLLGVKEETLEKFGAVSEETAIEMAEGAAEAFQTGAAVAETGIAEQTASSKPSGMVCVAVKVGDRVASDTYYFSRRRNSNRELAAVYALNFLRRVLLQVKEERSQNS
ncbi:MAG: competence/damage-inducible protein A [Firmicutes bacterium]|nr:competence/damage-inducible protein A [Bacillota bacterium]